jgi:hypothetical protein
VADKLTFQPVKQKKYQYFFNNLKDIPQSVKREQSARHSIEPMIIGNTHSEVSKKDGSRDTGKC